MLLNPDGNNVYGVINYPQIDDNLTTLISEGLEIRLTDIVLKISNFDNQKSLQYLQNATEFIIYQDLENNELLFNARFTGDSENIIYQLSTLFSLFSSCKIRTNFELYDDEIPPNLIFEIS